MRDDDTVYRIRTGLGDILVELRPDRAPVTCRNFVDYVRGGHYTPCSFYRLLAPVNQQAVACPIAVIQGGIPYDPIGGYAPERGLGPIRHESTQVTGLAHVDGAVTMGRFDPGETYGGFCICVGDQPELDHGGRRFPDGQGASAFGRVIEGMHVVRRIHARATANEFLAEPIPIITVVAIPQSSGGSLRAN